MRAGRGIIVIAITMVVGWLWIYAAGGENHVPPHWFYIPILMAAVRFGIPGALFTAIIAGVLAGPLMPAEVALGTHQLLSDELIRALWFLVIGGLMALVLARLKESLSREAGIAWREAELATHKAAVLATVSHEFRTPLSVLLGSAKMLVSQGGRPELETALLDGMLASARRLNDLVTTVLAVSEGPLSEAELIEAPASLQQIVSMVTSRMHARDSTRVRVDVSDVLVLTDPGVLESLLRQLIENALKFSAPKAVEVITTRQTEGSVQIVVADRGPGIDPQFLSHAFDPFTQQDASMTRTADGLGVGLFVARRLAEYLGITLELRERSGGGAEAALTLHMPLERNVIEPLGELV
jgi:signal transduction histidine kinase